MFKFSVSKDMKNEPIKKNPLKMNQFNIATPLLCVQKKALLCTRGKEN